MVNPRDSAGNSEEEDISLTDEHQKFVERYIYGADFLRAQKSAHTSFYHRNV